MTNLIFRGLAHNNRSSNAKNHALLVFGASLGAKLCGNFLLFDGKEALIEQDLLVCLRFILVCIGWLAVAVSEVFEVNFSVGNYDMIAL